MLGERHVNLAFAPPPSALLHHNKRKRKYSMAHRRTPQTWLWLAVLFVIITTSLLWRKATRSSPSQSMTAPDHLTLSSSAFTHESSIPSLYTRKDGDNISPPLRWTGIPSTAQSLALIVEDPDAPDPANPKVVWVHWVVYNIPVSLHGFEEGQFEGSVALNDFKASRYDGPQPPIGTHRYFFRLYALDKMLPNLGNQATKATLLEAMEGNIVAETELMGTYHKK